MGQPESLYGPNLTRPIQQRHQKARRRSSVGKTRILIAAFAVAASLFVLMAVLPDATRPATAGSAPLTVYGFVRDANGAPIQGAAVNITIIETGAFRTTTTEGDGGYSNSEDEFSMSEYNIGNTIRVTAEYDSESATNTTVVDELVDTNGVAQVDVRFSYQIPEFGGVLSVVVVIGFSAIVFLLSSRDSRIKKT